MFIQKAFLFCFCFFGFWFDNRFGGFCHYRLFGWFGRGDRRCCGGGG
jgi:hypothetical protein